MLKHSIRPKGIFMQAMERLTAKPHKPFPMSKLEFQLWFDREKIAEKFKVGDLLTNKYLPIIVNRKPSYYFSLGYINELHHSLSFDDQYQQPQVLHCKTPEGNWTYKSPNSVRFLTPEEIALVNLSNMQAQGTA